jgi:hypothetical protein
LPAGDSWTLTDTAEAIQDLSPSEIDQTVAIGVTAITATDNSLVFDIARIEAVANAAVAANNNLNVLVPSGGTVTVTDAAPKFPHSRWRSLMRSVGATAIVAESNRSACPITADGGRKRRLEQA